ncbi:putative MFS family arabinose efflux permease [Mycoplasma testudineum]|uniref:Putative MFS family arabinose efflux permease n=1 Tax=Mycoplasma testudineum TaxID=244584 RepID=A0A4R6IF83_9MOLU|nr:MFS transporter [Mycoplasma testudineum]OYD26887.1 hypothetical protein CG473_00925 [Mycoplasma testudineum]TDO20436.1 putative MFS family arabinose efflux permease [Mycoplasma testudineum]
MNFLKNNSVSRKFQELYRRLGTKALVALFILAAVDVFVIAAPYYIKLIFPNVHTILHVTESEFTRFISAIGYVTLITMLPGGWLADKISSKKLTALASFTTGLLTIWWATLILTAPDPIQQANGQLASSTGVLTQYFLIYIGWGVSSTLIFWTPLWKLVSQQAKKEDQGLSYGIQGTFNGIVGVTIIFIAGIIFQTIAQNVGWTPSYAVYAYWVAAFLILTTFAILKRVPEYSTKEKFALDLKNLWEVLKSPRIWLDAFFVMGMYMFQSVFAYYLLQYIKNVIPSAVSVPAIVLTVVGGFRTYAFRFFIATPTGRLADKAKSYIKTLTITLGLGFIVAIAFLAFPGTGRFENLSTTYQYVVMYVLIFLYLLAGALSWVMVTLRFATIGELPVPKKSYASTTALISFVAFSPDAWFYSMSAEVGQYYTPSGSSNTSQQGYNVIILIAISIAIVGWFCGLALYFWNKWELKKLGKTDFRWRQLENV